MRKKNLLGFTLIESLIVLLIAAILSTAMISGWQNWQQLQRMRNTALKLQRFLYDLRAFAHWNNSDQILWLKQDNTWCLGSGEKPSRDNFCNSNKKLQLIAPDPRVKIFSLIGEPGFYGKRDVAKAGSITFGEKDLRWRIIISTRGRIRLCKEEINLCQ